MRVASPGVPEKAPRDTEEGHNDRGWETPLRDWDTIVAMSAALVVGILIQTGEHAEDETREEGDLDESALRICEVVV